ncbi:MAG: GDCCVxC domain-containing (seleno)protein [Gammaproteobacteria bacterium]
MSSIILESELTCPNCGFTKQETMPTDACQFYYECISCKTLLRPLPGHCCVFCSYGSVPCPPVQEAHQQGIAAGGCCSMS